MSELEQESLRPDDSARGIIRRKRVSSNRKATVAGERGVPTRRPAPDGVIWPSDGFEANQFSPAGEVAAFGNFFQAVRRRWRRASPRARIAIGASMLAIAVSFGLFGRGNGSGLPSTQSVVPHGATLLSTRSVGNRTFRIYGSTAAGASPASVVVSYEELKSHVGVINASSGPVSALIGPGGVVPQSFSPSDSEFVGAITDPSTAVVRLMAGDEVLDAMSPVNYDGVRLVLLAAINDPTPTSVEELDLNGRPIHTAPVADLP